MSRRQVPVRVGDQPRLHLLRTDDERHGQDLMAGEHPAHERRRVHLAAEGGKTEDAPCGRHLGQLSEACENGGAARASLGKAQTVAAC